MDYRILQAHGRERGEGFYLDALRYAQYLWQEGRAGRAILALTRALYAEVPAGSPVLAQCPLPYAALRWIVSAHHSDQFPGNPRVSFQHQANRLRGARRELRAARAWAAWAVVRAARPTLPGDPAEALPEPSLATIGDWLGRHAHPGEVALWREALQERPA